MEVSSCVLQRKNMYVVVCIATLTTRFKGFHAYKKQVDITVGHVPDLLAHALASEISGGNIVSTEAIVTGEPRRAPEGTWVIGGGIETPCKYLIYADKKLKSKIRTKLRKALM